VKILKARRIVLLHSTQRRPHDLCLRTDHAALTAAKAGVKPAVSCSSKNRRAAVSCKYRHFVGNGIPKLIERIIPVGSPHEVYEKVYEEFCSYYNKHMYDKTEPYDGMNEMLCRLRQKGVRLAVVTNKAHIFANEMVKKYYGDVFDAVFGSVEGLPKKPDPYWVKKALEEIKCRPEECVYVGDSSVDMQTAQNSGIFSCGVLWGFRERDELLESGAKALASDSAELEKIILEHFG